MLRASLTFLGTEVGGCGGAEFGKEVGPENKIQITKLYTHYIFETVLIAFMILKIGCY